MGLEDLLERFEGVWTLILVVWVLVSVVRQLLGAKKQAQGDESSPAVSRGSVPEEIARLLGVDREALAEMLRESDDDIDGDAVPEESYAAVSEDITEEATDEVIEAAVEESAEDRPSSAWAEGAEGDEALPDWQELMRRMEQSRREAVQAMANADRWLMAQRATLRSHSGARNEPRLVWRDAVVLQQVLRPPHARRGASHAHSR